MARIFTESFENGTAGAAITTANTGFTTTPANGAIFETSATVGALVARLTTPSTGANRPFTLTLGTRSVLYATTYIWMDALPPGNWYVMGVGGSGAARASLVINTDGTLSLRNGSTTVYTSTATVPTADVVRLEWRVDLTAGVQAARVYHYNSTTLLFTSGDQTYNAGTFDTFQSGILAPNVANMNVAIDWVALDDSTWTGPATVNQPPQVSAGADQTGIAAGATVTLTGTASDPDGTIASRTWTQTGGTTVTLSGTGNTRTFTAPSSGSPSTLTFQFSATDNLGLTSSDTMTVGVLATGSPATGAPVVSAGADQTVEPWSTVTLTGTATDAGGSIASRSWTQTAGTPTVTLSGASTDTATFTAPGTLDGTSLTFQYSATDNSALTTTDTATVAVYPAAVRAVIDGALVPVQVKAVSQVVAPRSQESAWAGPATATTDSNTVSSWAGPVSATTDSSGSVLVAELPFAMPSRATMAAAGKPVIAYLHTLPPYGSYADDILPSGSPDIGGRWRQRPWPFLGANLTDAQKIDAWTDEITMMSNIGIDGASQNILFSSGPGSDRWNNYVMPLYRAAEQFTANNTPGFSVAPNLSMLSLGNNGANATTWAGYMAPLLKSSAAQKMPDGRPMVYLYNVDNFDPSWYVSFANALQTNHQIDVAMIPSHQASTPTGGSRSMDLYKTALFNTGRFAMLHQWATASYTTSVSSIGSSFRSWCATNNVPYCGSVGPAWENDRPENGLGAPKEKEGYGTLILQNMWQSSINNDDPMVQIISWNDHEESHNIRPATGYQWVPYDVTAYYLARYKTGSNPTITRDALYYFHRMHHSLATYNTSVQTRGGFQNTGSMVNKFLVLAFLKGISDVTITAGGVAHLNSNVPAGVSYIEEDFVANTTAKFKAVRGGVTVVPEFSSAFPTRGRATNPQVTYQDLLYRMGSSTRPPIPGVQSDMPEDR